MRATLDQHRAFRIFSSIFNVFLSELEVSNVNEHSFNCDFFFLQLALTIVYIAVGVFVAGWIGK